ncbi:tetratricopeptide repeat protein [Anaeromicropila herbilytica]|uniref:Peptide transporter n=1 Tax=Anaeromicropila herbilytica TaxID=2785025 RepID=A0A7R7ENT5_9FIRM|nr:tetratricopeptide repeat protein [Anaeromicropila herbilytica]BCN32350.1 peptide transporter [Anaeromicropila herbilytica]
MNSEEQRLQAIEYNEQAKVLQDNKNEVEAFNYYNKAITADPMYIETYLNLGNFLASREEFTKAEDNFKKALMINKHDGRIYFHLGNVAFINNDTSKGIEYYNKAISEGFLQAQLYFNLGMVYEETDKMDLALRNYTKAISLDLNIPEYRIRKASLQISLHMYQEALTTLAELMQFMPDVFEGYHYSFEILCMLGEFEEAKVIIDKALVLFPNDISLFYDSIKYHTLTNRYDEALDMIQTAMNMDGFEIEERNLTLEQGKLYTIKQDFEKARDFFEKCKEFERDDEIDYEARYLLMNVYLAIQKYESLLNNANEILAKDVDDNIYVRAAYYYRPLALQKLGQDEEAKQYYKEAISMYRLITIHEPTLMDAYMFRVLCLKGLKDYEKGLELLAFIEKINDAPEVHVTRADMYREMGDSLKADEEMNLAIKMKPELINFDRRKML